MPAEFKLGPEGIAAIRRLADAPNQIKAGSREGLADHALKLKREFQQTRRRGAKGMRYEDPVPDGDGWRVTFGLRYIAAWHETGTRRHIVVPRGLGRARTKKGDRGQAVHALTKRQAVAGGKRALATPSGPRARANPAGVKAGHYFERLVAKRTAQGDQAIGDGVMRRMQGR